MRTSAKQDAKRAHDLLVRTAGRHAKLQAADESAIRSLPIETRTLAPEEDVVCQGERPVAAVFILRGTLARYQTLPSGDRQYLSLHIAADMPDIQSLHLKVMDHSVCALSNAVVGLIQHDSLTPVLQKRPTLVDAFWRITLVDAAIFRQAITNNSARGHPERLAHFCCEQFSRHRDAGLIYGDTCPLPLNQAQLGQTLGMSHVSANRALQRLRKDGLLDLRAGELTVNNWRALTRFAGFDPAYLHIDKDT